MAVARAEQIPLPSRSIDVVVCAQSFHLFDQLLALPEITRVLRPGGRVAVSDLALLRPLPQAVEQMVEALIG